MSNLHPHNYHITKIEKEKQFGHSSLVVWLTGLSGSGKSTIADHLEQHLFKKGIHTANLDGDLLRTGLNKDLGFSEEDRSENIRRIAEISKILSNNGLVVIAAFVSPFSKDRNLVKKTVGEENFIEIFVQTSIEECERRDVKGLYSKARKGELKNFTGIDSPYENPINPDLIIDTEKTSIEDSVQLLCTLVLSKIQFKK
ncbi:MAG: adenylyl-sulfate kinase [Crocinitomicaceae bacterium]|nr:adenylyl-sulfate kinase [Crocinitomicaceae bacterium]MCF8434665.1 adenylyl-sulfate kinase [Crocinitomicaceae bacterium]